MRVAAGATSVTVMVMIVVVVITVIITAAVTMATVWRAVIGTAGSVIRA